MSTTSTTGEDEGPILPEPTDPPDSANATEPLDPPSPEGPPSPPEPPSPERWRDRVQRRTSSVFRDSRFATFVGVVGVIAAFAALVPVVSDWFSKDVEVQVVDSRSGQATSPNLVIPLQLEDLSPPPNVSDSVAIKEWADSIGGVYGENMSVGFVARSEQLTPTIITALRVEVVSRDEPLQGTWIVPDGGGPQDERVVLADLDADPPTAILDGSFAFPLRINNSEVELFSVRAQASDCYCLWQIELDVIGVDGKSRTVIVDDDGQPFELTGTGNAEDRTFLPSTPGAPWPGIE